MRTAYETEEATIQVTHLDRRRWAWRTLMLRGRNLFDGKTIEGIAHTHYEAYAQAARAAYKIRKPKRRKR